MKQCPACQSQYTDDSLQFCLQDGSPLRFVGGPQSGAGEQETVVSNRSTSEAAAPSVASPAGRTPNYGRTRAALPAEENKSSMAMPVLLTALVMLVLFGLGGLGAWLYFRGPTPADNGNLFIAKKSPSPEPANKATSADNSKPQPSATIPRAADTEQVRRDVSSRVNSWKSAAESRNLDNYMSHYAGTIDYYNKKGASFATVRADKAKAFGQYDSMEINVSNMSVTPDASGDNATAVFDKQWVFSGDGYSAGKVQSQLKLKRVNNQWLITGERDLKVYYTQ